MSDESFGEQIQAAAMAALPSRWAAAKRHIRDERTHLTAPWGFRHREWQRQLMDDTSSRVVIMKAAQMGVTEIGMTRAMHAVDALGMPVLYLFPTADDVSDFSAGRFDPMLEDSPALAELFTDVSNVGLKRAGSTCLYLRDSRSPSQIKSIPVAALVLDEFDEMQERSVALARKRLTGHADTWELDLSTPTYPGVGIAAEYEQSDQHEWWIPCPHCGEFQVLDFAVNVQLGPDEGWKGSEWICSECHETWTNDERLDAIDLGEWRPRNPDATIRGYHISQLYSPALGDREVTGAEAIAREFVVEANKSVEHLTDFYNSVLGLAWEPEGLKITPGAVRDCVGSYAELDRHPGPAFLGIDVGTFLHFQVWVPGDGGPRAIKVGKTDWAGVDLLMVAYNVEVCVIDAMPERQKAHEFRDRWPGTVYLAFYPAAEHMAGQMLQWNDDNGTVNLHRSGISDTLARRIVDRAISFPRELTLEAIRHMSNVYRALEEGPDGRLRAKWKHRGPDHTFHAGNYAEAAIARVEEFDLDGGGTAADEDFDPVWVGMEEGGGFPSTDDAAWG